MNIQGAIGTFKSNNRTPTQSYNGVTGDLFLTRMMNNPNYKTSIFLPNNLGVVTGYCEGPFAFQGKADWKPIANVGQYEEAVAALDAGRKALGTAMGADMSQDDLTQLSFKQIRGSEMRYAGSGCPVFQIKLILPSYDAAARQSPMDSLKLLMMCVYPEYRQNSTIGRQQAAPLGYGIRGASDQANDAPSGGTVLVKRGRFFRAPNMLIQSVSSSFSQECMTDGYPLYIEANIEFIPWRTPDYATAMSWFGNFSASEASWSGVEK